MALTFNLRSGNDLHIFVLHISTEIFAKTRALGFKKQHYFFVHGKFFRYFLSILGFFSAARCFAVLGLFGNVFTFAWMLGYTLEKLMDYDPCTVASLITLSFTSGNIQQKVC